MSENRRAVTPMNPCDPLQSDPAWTLLLGVNEKRRAGFNPRGAVGFSIAPDGALLTTTAADTSAQLIWDAQGLRAAPSQPPAVREFVELYSPLFPSGPDGSSTIAHLGQSIDSRIATQSGDSYYVTGPGDIVHLHRMRALCDAVLVGAGTVSADNPRLTTRLVEGRNPVRIVIDPERRVSCTQSLFNDGEAPSLIVCAADRLLAGDTEETVIGLARDDAGLVLPDLVAALSERSLRSLFIEGGGVTVSRWLIAGLLDRLQVSVAPVFVGDGRPAFKLPPAMSMSTCLRPRSRVFRLGEDLLWDFDLRNARAQQQQSDGRALWPRRIT